MEFSNEIPVFIFRKCGGINCWKEGNGTTDAPDYDDGKDDYDLGYPEIKTQILKVNTNIKSKSAKSFPNKYHHQPTSNFNDKV